MQIVDEQTNGETSSDGKWLTGGGNWSAVRDNDILSVTRPGRLAFKYKIDMVGSDGVYFNDALIPDVETIAYTIERSPWIEVDEGFSKDGNIEFSIVNGAEVWKDNMWDGARATDRVGGIHTILGNSSSVLRVTEGAPGSIDIRPVFAGDRSEEFFIPEHASVVEEGGYVRRFEPLTDGSKITDWRSDIRWDKSYPSILVLTSNADGSTSVSTDTTERVFTGEPFILRQIGLDDINVSVESITSPTSLSLSKQIPSSYEAGRAYLVPTRLQTEGLKGFYVILEGSNSGATCADGITLTDSSAEFTSHDIREGDSVRIITSSGGVLISRIEFIQSDTEIELDTAVDVNLSNVYYEIVHLYEPTNFSAINVDAAPYESSLYNREIVERVIEAFTPSHVRSSYIDSAIETIRFVSNVLEEIDLEIVSEDSRITVTSEPELIVSMTNGEDRVNDNFVAGPVTYNWAISEVYRAVFST